MVEPPGKSPRTYVIAGMFSIILAVCVAACVFVEDHGPGIRIWNRTDAQITVTYFRPDGSQDAGFGEFNVDPGMETRETSLFRASANNLGCVPGTLVATQGGRQIASLHAPCEGAAWEVRLTL